MHPFSLFTFMFEYAYLNNINSNKNNISQQKTYIIKSFLFIFDKHTIYTILIFYFFI